MPRVAVSSQHSGNIAVPATIGQWGAFFSDQAALWLANDAYPVRFAVSDVVEGATKREVYRPAQ